MRWEERQEKDDGGGNNHVKEIRGFDRNISSSLTISKEKLWKENCFLFLT